MSTSKKPDDRFWGIAAVAGAFGIIGAGMLHVAYGFGFASTIGFYLLIATVVAGVLALGWRDPAKPAPVAPAHAAEPAAAKPAVAAAAPAVTVDLHTPVPHAESDHVEPAGPGVRPSALDAPRDGRPDDLKLIKGVGPALEKLCHSLGFYHFDQIANWTDEEIAWVDQNLEGFKGRVTRDNWVAQARALAGTPHA